MKFSFKTIDRGWEKILKGAKEESRRRGLYVKIGVLGGANAKERRDGISNVELALVHEFGSPKNNIPERSFIRAPFRARVEEYRKMLKALVSGTLSKGSLDILRALKIMGEKIAADFKKTAPGTPPPNAPATLARKLAKTRIGSQGSPKTLVDTGRLVDSISYVVVNSRDAAT